VDVFEAIRTRRSIRKYKDKPVEKEKLLREGEALEDYRGGEIGALDAQPSALEFRSSNGFQSEGKIEVRLQPELVCACDYRGMRLSGKSLG